MTYHDNLVAQPFREPVIQRTCHNLPLILTLYFHLTTLLKDMKMKESAFLVYGENFIYKTKTQTSQRYMFFPQWAYINSVYKVIQQIFITYKKNGCFCFSFKKRMFRIYNMSLYMIIALRVALKDLNYTSYMFVS